MVSALLVSVFVVVVVVVGKAMAEGPKNHSNPAPKSKKRGLLRQCVAVGNRTVEFLRILQRRYVSTVLGKKLVGRSSSLAHSSVQVEFTRSQSLTGSTSEL